MKHVGNLSYPKGAKKKNKRIGRGPGSGHGGTSTKGHKGAQSRSGFHQFRGFEGGQMPLNRRLPKFGFHNRFRVDYQVVNVGRLQEIIDKQLAGGNEFNFDLLYKVGAISKKDIPVKILGNGNITSAITITAHSFSESAKQKIESAGGTVIIHE
jgi:large subunit ribosomal protein L15